MTDPDERVRVAGWRAVRQHLESDREELLILVDRLARDESAALRREVAIAMRDVPLGEARDALMALAEGYDGRDRYYLEALGIGCDGKEGGLYPELLNEFGDADPLKWSEAFGDIMWRLHPVAAVPALAARAHATSLPPAARRQAMDTLAFIRDRSAAEAMLALATSGPVDVQPAALWWARFRAGNDWKDHGIAGRLPDSSDGAAGRSLQAKVQAWREVLLNSSAVRAEREEAALSLAGTEAGGFALLNLASNDRIPPEFIESITEGIFRNRSPAVRALASQYFKRPSRTGEAFPSIAELMKERGDPERGRKVFNDAGTACAQCHAFAGQGGDLGPDLSTARTKLGREGLLDSILNPSAVIAAGYEPWLIETRAGEIYSGFILSDGETVTLKEPSGSIRNIPRGNVVSRQQQNLSLMPDNMGAGLSPQELLDLVEYLMSDPAPGIIQ